MTSLSTPDLCDAHPGLKVVKPMLQSFGGTAAFGGEIVTVNCFEDNALIKQLAGEAGNARVMVVDGGGSRRRALLGDVIGAMAVANNWAGFIIYGSVRDVDELAKLPLGVLALGAIPMRPDQHGQGDLNVPVTFGGVTFATGQFVYADNNGVVCAERALV